MSIQNQWKGVLLLKAYFYEGGGAFSLHSTEIKEPRKNEVVVKVHYCGVCGSDLHIAEGTWDERIATFPRVIGHEASGEIVEMGSAVSGWSIGDRVVIRPLRTCGTCPACRSGNGNVCKNVKYLGIEEDGAFQNYWTVDAGILHRCPDGLSYEHSALVEPLAVCCHAVARSEISAGDTAVVIGGGPIGLMTAVILKSKGVRVVVSELNPARLANCEKMGIPCLNPTEEDLNGYVSQMTAGEGVDVVFEASGSQAGLSVAPELCRPNGKIVTVATYAKPMQLLIKNLHYKQVCLITTRAYQEKDFEEALDMMQKKMFDCDALISRIMPLEKLEEAIALGQAGADVVKILIDCQSVQD